MERFDAAVVGAGPAGSVTAYRLASAGASVLLAVGARAKGRSLVYPASEVARKHGAGVEQETAKPEEAYARFAELERSGYRDGDLPGL